MQPNDNQLRTSAPDNIELPLHIPNSSRITLAELFAKRGYTKGAEIGVQGGLFSEILCKTIPNLHLFCIDLWKPYDGYIDYTDPSYLEGEYQRALQLLAPYNVEFIRKDSMNALKIVPDGSLDFVYIDANHLSPWIDDDIYWWSKKVRPGGIVSGHDYVSNHMDVINAVKQYVSKNGISPYWIVGMEGEPSPDLMCSWFWIKGENELER